MVVITEDIYLGPAPSSDKRSETELRAVTEGEIINRLELCFDCVSLENKTQWKTVWLFAVDAVTLVFSVLCGEGQCEAVVTRAVRTVSWTLQPQLVYIQVYTNVTELLGATGTFSSLDLFIHSTVNVICADNRFTNDEWFIHYTVAFSYLSFLMLLYFQ